MEEGTAKPNFLDPTAEEFIPSSSSSQFNLPRPHQVYPPYPYYAPPQQAAADDNAESRSVVLSMVPPHVTESSLAHAMSAFGGVRAVELSSLVTEGIVTVHFYDLRSAQIAVAEIREQHVRQQSLLGQQYNNYGAVLENWGPPPNLMMMMMMTNQQQRGLIDGRAVWAQFASRGFDAMNQGSLYVAVSDPPISADDLKQIFQAFGPVKEVREAPSRKQHKFVEFYDVRDAARALIDLQNKVIGGRRFYIEFSRPAGSSSYHHQYRSRRMGHQNPGLPPRLARSNSSQASSSSSGSRGEGIVTTRRTSDARISNIVRNSSDGNKKKKNKESSSSCSSSSNATSLSKHHQQLSRKGGNWRNHGKSDAKNTGGGSSSSSTSSSRFQIKDVMEESECGSGSKLICRDSRTTVMIKNIPNKYSQKLLLNMLDNHCIHCNEQIIGEGGEGAHEHDHDQDQPFSAYDFVYLPIDFNNKCNVGYGFVNLTSPEATVSLYKAFHMQPWEVFNSRKICQVTYARLQGLEALKEHFKNSKFPCDNDEYFPVVFDPPRDGKQLTEPVAIGGRTSDSHCIKIRDAIDELGGASSTTASTQAPSDHDECEDHGDDDEDSEGPDGGRDETGCGISDALDQLAASSSLA